MGQSFRFGQVSGSWVINFYVGLRSSFVCISELVKGVLNTVNDLIETLPFVFMSLENFQKPIS